MALLAAQALVGKREAHQSSASMPDTPRDRRRPPSATAAPVTSASVQVTGTSSPAADAGSASAGGPGSSSVTAVSTSIAASCGNGHRHGQSFAATATRIRCPGRNRQPVAIRSSSTSSCAVTGEVDRTAGDRLRFALRRDVVQLHRDDRPRARMCDPQLHSGRAQHLDRLGQRLALEHGAQRLVCALVAEQPAVGRRRAPVAGGEADADGCRSGRRAAQHQRRRRRRLRPAIAANPASRHLRPVAGRVVLLDEDHRARAGRRRRCVGLGAAQVRPEEVDQLGMNG